ncbi:hypothetical protein ACUOA8_22520, partial [Escherichia sp. SS-MK2]
RADSIHRSSLHIKKRPTSEDVSRCFLCIDLAFRQGLTYNKKGIRLRIPFGLPGDRMWFFTHRNDDRPAMKLLPFAGNKV